MKSMQPPSVAIFFMIYFHRAGGGTMAPSAPPGSATVYNCPIQVILSGFLPTNCFSCSFLCSETLLYFNNL